MKKLIILSTQVDDRYYRLQRFQEDFRMIHQYGNAESVSFILPGIDEVQLNALGVYNNFPNQGVISNPNISQWIINKGYNHLANQSPTRLLFSLEIENDIHRYVFVGKIEDINPEYFQHR